MMVLVMKEKKLMEKDKEEGNSIMLKEGLTMENGMITGCMDMESYITDSIFLKLK
jgi:hypothetical protein